MADLKPFKAILHRDGARFLMARGAWRSGWMPIADLPKWIRFYRSLRDRKAVPADTKARTLARPGPYHHHYAPCVEALEALQQQAMEKAA